MSGQYEPYPAPAPAPAPSVTIELGLGPYQDWDSIDITGIGAAGTHGVYEHEQHAPQPFVVDVRLWVSTEHAAASDALDDTIDYVWVGQLAARVVSRRSFALIEKLADVIAVEILSAAGPHQAVSVTVHKPLAAEAAGAADVAVTVHRHVKAPMP